MQQTQANRLINETSPYLLQHAHNPVDWYPWGEEAFSKAAREDKPVFLSIGYSACHWCHVMAHESFENDSTAAIMNEHFVNIKVDREERPDIDDAYMSFVQMTSGSGGWPMSVFLTPDKKPFFGGTYFPPQDAYGRPGFPGILLAVSDAWKNDRDKVVDSANSVSERLLQLFTSNSKPAPIKGEVIDRAAAELMERYDPIDGGFGGAPKFPPSYSLELLMRFHYRTKDARTLKAITHTLDKMAYGGMFDQLGGGFHRYSVDAQWLVPHFEKMLYDNALLAKTYFEAYRLTRKPLYLTTGRSILDYVAGEMTDSAGGFHSAQDADSDGKEGEFYVWTPEEVIDVLGSNDGKLFCDFYDVTNAGNFEHGKSILHIRVSPQDFAQRYGITESELDSRLAAMKLRLLEARSKRRPPHKDDKVLTDWNALMISAFARGYQASGDAGYLEMARRSANFILNTMRTDKGLMRVYRQGTVKLPGFITDYAFFVNCLIDLFESDFDPRWLRAASELAGEMVERYSDKVNGGLFMTVGQMDDLPYRLKDTYDSSAPSGSSVAALALLRLSRLLDNSDYRANAESIFESLAANVNRVPAAYLNLLNAVDYHLNPSPEIVIAGGKNDAQSLALIKGVYAEYLPNPILVLFDPDDPDGKELASMISLLQHRNRINGLAAAYVCRNFVCKRPVTNTTDLARELKLSE